MPTLNAASESPAIKPPPTSDIVLMSAGRSPSETFLPAASFFWPTSKSEDPTPPAVHQRTAGSSTKPPKDEAYGLGSTTASMRKSVVLPPNEVSANVL